jgi:hypothetical protein
MTTPEEHTGARAPIDTTPCEIDCMDVTLCLLRAYGSPLVCPTPDGVHVGKSGTWAHGRTLAEALDALEAKLKEKQK